MKKKKKKEELVLQFPLFIFPICVVRKFIITGNFFLKKIIIILFLRFAATKDNTMEKYKNWASK